LPLEERLPVSSNTGLKSRVEHEGSPLARRACPADAPRTRDKTCQVQILGHCNPRLVGWMRRGQWSPQHLVSLRMRSGPGAKPEPDAEQAAHAYKRSRPRQPWTPERRQGHCTWRVPLWSCGEKKTAPRPATPKIEQGLDELSTSGSACKAHSGAWRGAHLLAFGTQRRCRCLPKAHQLGRGAAHGAPQARGCAGAGSVPECAPPLHKRCGCDARASAEPLLERLGRARRTLLGAARHQGLIVALLQGQQR